MKGSIYLIRNIVNGKGYVGQTMRPVQERLREHFSDARLKRTRMSLHLAIAKYGEASFSVIEIASAEEGEVLNELEVHYIKTLRTLTCENGYNISLGGKGRASGFTLSEEAKRKISMAKKGKKLSDEHKAKIAFSGIGRHWKRSTPITDEERRKRSEAMKGKKLPPRVFTEEHKTKLALAAKGNKSKTGQKASQETKRKMSIAHIGKTAPTKGKPWSLARREAQDKLQLRKFESEVTQ